MKQVIIQHTSIGTTFAANLDAHGEVTAMSNSLNYDDINATDIAEANYETEDIDPFAPVDKGYRIWTSDDFAANDAQKAT